MGAKLAGYDVVGYNEIDTRMTKYHDANHNCAYKYVEGIQTFKERDDLPAELYELDVLLGSPPCSSFSACGNREKDWGKLKKFREGQKKQVLDTLFFDYIDLAKKLRPKVIIAENVQGLMQGNAIQYLERIVIAFENAGYNVDWRLLDASLMGVPQKRKRIIFYAIRSDLADIVGYDDMIGLRPRLDLDFNERPIFFGEVEKNIDYNDLEHCELTDFDKKWLPLTKVGDDYGTIHPNGSGFNHIVVGPNMVCPTILTRNNALKHYNKERNVSITELMLCCGWPLDYDFLGNKKAQKSYVIGMSVPPVMMGNIMKNVYEYWLKRII